MSMSAVWARSRERRDVERNRSHLCPVVGCSGAVFLNCRDQFEQMSILDLLDPIREHYEVPVDFVELMTIEVVSQLFAAQAQCVASRMFSKHQLRVGHADR